MDSTSCLETLRFCGRANLLLAFLLFCLVTDIGKKPRVRGWGSHLCGHVSTDSLFIVFTATLRMESSWLSWPSITAPNSPVGDRRETLTSEGLLGTAFPVTGYGWGSEGLHGSGECAHVLVGGWGGRGAGGNSPSPSVFPRATLCRSTITSRSFSFSSSLMPRLFTAWGVGVDRAVEQG